MRSYGQYCPMAMALEVLGDRWTLLIIRDLMVGASRFNELARGLPGISRTLLAARLRQLERDGLVERYEGDTEQGAGYRLTQAGLDLEPVAEALVSWGARWAFGEPRPDQLDPVLLMWWMRGGVQRDRLSRRRVVVQFDFRGVTADPMWLLLEPHDVAVCLTPPGDVDLLVTADLSTLYQVWYGRVSLESALRRGLVQLDGLPSLTRAFPTWWAWSPAAVVVRAAAEEQARAAD